MNNNTNTQTRTRRTALLVVLAALLAIGVVATAGIAAASLLDGPETVEVAPGDTVETDVEFSEPDDAHVIIEFDEITDVELEDGETASTEADAPAEAEQSDSTLHDGETANEIDITANDPGTVTITDVFADTGEDIHFLSYSWDEDNATVTYTDDDGVLADDDIVIANYEFTPTGGEEFQFEEEFNHSSGQTEFVAEHELDSLTRFETADGDDIDAEIVGEHNRTIEYNASQVDDGDTIDVRYDSTWTTQPVELAFDSVEALEDDFESDDFEDETAWVVHEYTFTGWTGVAEEDIAEDETVNVSVELINHDHVNSTHVTVQSTGLGGGAIGDFADDHTNAILFVAALAAIAYAYRRDII